MNPIALLTLAPGLYLLGAGAAVALSRKPSAARLAAGGLALVAAVAGLAVALPVLLSAGSLRAELFRPTPFLSVGLRLDPLAAWFVALLSGAALAIALAGLAYGRAYDRHGGPRLAACTNLFVAAMLGVLLADGAFGFLLAWELMSVASYFLVAHEHEQPAVRRAGFVYLVMTHLGTAFLLVAFLLLRAEAGAWDFEAFQATAPAIAPPARDLIFALALVGFGTKMGLVPLHVWLPRAHPLAPSHVSALMSGVMLKIGLYGLLRLVWEVLGAGPAWWGGLVLGLGLVSAVLGVLYALMEQDMKRLLAYSSIENLGIALVGVGAGLMLVSAGQPAAAALALAAGLFHALNHSLFKGLLFLGAGAIQQACGTRDLEALGGLIKRMPQTGFLMLVGSMAISALPPLNGFASEWLTFQSLLALAGPSPTLWGAVGMGLSVGLLAMTAALAAACFVKLFGIAFLALPRSQAAAEATEAPPLLRAGMSLLALACLGLGLWPGLALQALARPTAALAGVAVPAQAAGVLVGPTSQAVPPVLLGVLSLGVALAILANRWLSGRWPARVAPTWACGFALRPEMQYGSAAFAKPVRLFFRALLQPQRTVEAEYGLAPYFLTRLRTWGAISPLFERHLYEPVTNGLLRTALRARTFQSGSVRLYLVYILVTLVLLLVWLR